MSSKNTGVVALISGRGSNLGAIIEQVQSGSLPIQLQAVISNNPDAKGLQLAARARIPTHVIDHRQYPHRDSYDAALMQQIDSYRPQLVVLAGFMRVLGHDFVAHYQGRLMNIHPSLLPAYPGLNTHARALTSGAKIHGASVHFVSAEVDAGAIIAQAQVPVYDDDNPEILAARVLQQEHRIYPQAIRWFAEGRLSLRDGQAWLDQSTPLPLDEPNQTAQQKRTTI